MNNEPGMSLIVKTVTRITFGLTLMYGIYVVIHGHIIPGGGPAGGIMLALAFISLMLAYGKDVALQKLPKNLATFLESMGGVMILAIALFGFMGGYFFLNFFHTKGTAFKLFSAGIIPLVNIAIGLKIGASIFSIAIFILVILFSFLKEKK